MLLTTFRWKRSLSTRLTNFESSEANRISAAPYFWAISNGNSRKTNLVPQQDSNPLPQVPMSNAEPHEPPSQPGFVCSSWLWRSDQISSFFGIPGKFLLSPFSVFSRKEFFSFRNFRQICFSAEVWGIQGKWPNHSQTICKAAMYLLLT